MREDTYDMSRSRLLSYIIPRFSQLDLPLVNKGKEWHHFYGFDDKPIPIDALVCPIMIDNARGWYLGWYKGKDEEGNHLVESIETRTICKFCNCGFYYLDPKEFEGMPQLKYSDHQFYQHYLISRKYAKVEDFAFRVGWTVFHDDGSFTVKCRKAYNNTWVERTYKSMRAVTKKQINAHFQEIMDVVKKENEGKTEGKQTLITML